MLEHIVREIYLEPQASQIIQNCYTMFNYNPVTNQPDIDL